MDQTPEPLDQLLRRSLEREVAFAQALALGKLRDAYGGLSAGVARYLVSLVACGLGVGFLSIGAVWGLGELLGGRYWLSLLLVGAFLLVSAALTLGAQRARVARAATEAAERRASA